MANKKEKLTPTQEEKVRRGMLHGAHFGDQENVVFDGFSARRYTKADADAKASISDGGEASMVHVTGPGERTDEVEPQGDAEEPKQAEAEPESTSTQNASTEQKNTKQANTKTVAPKTKSGGKKK